MKIRAKYQLITAALIISVVVSIAVMVIHTQRKVLHAQAMQRLEALMEGSALIAKESFASHDRLMAVSYLMFLQKTYQELAFASVSCGGRLSKIGNEANDLIYLESSVRSSAGSQRNNVWSYPSGAGAPQSNSSVSAGSAPPEISGQAEAPGAPPSCVVRLGFAAEIINRQVKRGLDPLIHWTAGITGFFLLLGLVVNAGVTRLLTGPIEALAQATGLLAAGTTLISVPVRSNDEMGTLTQSFNSMAGRITELMESREDILHTLTHEINTPLSGLKGYLELWQDRKLAQDPAQNQEVVDTMMVAVVRMENSLSNALNLFRSEHKPGSPGEIQSVRIEEIFKQTLTMFMPMALAKNIKIFPLPPAKTGCITAQEELIKQIVMNLVSNAIKYTPDHGEIRMGLEENPDEVRFHVSNTGHGIPPENIPHLFTKFYRSGEDRASGKRIPGTGLGLNIVHKAVAALGGKVWVESQVGENTMFIVRLPKSGSII